MENKENKLAAYLEILTYGDVCDLMMIILSNFTAQDTFQYNAFREKLDIIATMCERTMHEIDLQKIMENANGNETDIRKKP